MSEESRQETDQHNASIEADLVDQIRSKAEDYFTFYANNISIAFSSWDVSLIFGEITGQKDGKTEVEEISKIIMTREFAKVVSVLLGKNIAAYEKMFGEIKSPHFQFKDEDTVDFSKLSPSASSSRSPSASVSPSASPSASLSPESDHPRKERKLALDKDV